MMCYTVYVLDQLVGKKSRGGRSADYHRLHGGISKFCWVGLEVNSSSWN